MRKVGAWLMLAASVVLGLLGVVSGINLTLTLITIGSDASASAYGIGALTGQIVVLILILGIAWKLFTKGRALLSRDRSASIGDGAT